MKWTMTCDSGHAPESWHVEAATKEEAYDKFMAMPECQQHGKDKHPDMTGMDPEQMKSMIMDSIKPADQTGM